MIKHSKEAQSQAGSLVPPQGAVFGSIIQSLGPFSQDAKWSDDKTVGSQTQTSGGSANSQYYVYWVNGVGNPYYVVIQRITASFAPGNVLAKGPNSFGFFQSIVTVTSTLAAPDATASMIAHSPGTFVSSQGSIDAPVNIDVPMILLLPTGGGWSPQSFEAQEQTAIPLPDWGILDESQPSNLALRASFHQINPWDLISRPASDWPNWYTAIYDLNDNPVSPANFSTGTLQFEVIVAWMLKSKVDSAISEPGAAPPPPPSLSVTVATGFSQELAAWHNIAGCNSVCTGSGAVKSINGVHHIYAPRQDFGPYTWSADLQKIVKP